jgi:solute carrier family 25 (mitochondrial carnitine/acylcarnitine transporter), member 20/29
VELTKKNIFFFFLVTKQTRMYQQIFESINQRNTPLHNATPTLNNQKSKINSSVSKQKKNLLFQNKTQKNMAEEFKAFIAGWAGGTGLLLVGHPFDTVKVLLQSAEPGKYASTADCVKRLYKADGLAGFYRGVQAPLAGVGAVFASYFLAYAAAERAIRAQKGYKPEQELTMAEIMICGGATGVVGSLILAPAELLKTHQQLALQRKEDPSFGATVKRVYARGGLPALTQGFGATLARDVPGSMAWFGAYEAVKSAISKDPKNPGVGEALIAGGCGGTAMWTFALPLDAIKTRVQGAQTKMTFGGAFKEIMATNGIAGFYRGFGPALARAFPANAACFACKEMTKQQLDKIM